MLEQHPTELELASAFRAYLEDAPIDVRPVDVAHRLLSEYPRRRGIEGWVSGLPQMGWLLLLALLVLAMVAGLLVAGGWPRERAIVIAPSPALGRWVAVSGAEAIATDPILIPAGSGHALVVEGGGSPSSCLAREAPPGSTAAWVYDQETHAFSATQPLPEGSSAKWGLEVSFAKLADGRVLAVGGVAGDEPLGHSWIWDPATGAWAAAAPLNTPTFAPSLLTLPDGRVVAAWGSVPDAGAGAGAVPTQMAEIYDPTSDRWTVWDEVPPQAGKAVVLDDGRILMFAVGYALNETFDQLVPPTQSERDRGVMVWDVNQRVSQILAPSLIRTDRDPLLALPDGTFLTIDELGAARVFDRTAGWRAVGGLQVARTGATFTALVDGRVLVAGGADPLGSSTWLDTAELFDPRAGTSALISMPMPWAHGEGVRLPDGSVLMAGTMPYTGSDGDCNARALRWLP